MVALTADRLDHARVGSQTRLHNFPADADVIVYRGALVQLLGSALTPAAKGDPLARVVGVAISGVDTTGLAISELSVDVQDGVWVFKNAAGGAKVTLANVGQVVFVEDDQTVRNDNDVNTAPIAGVCHYVDDADNVHVEVGPTVTAALT